MTARAPPLRFLAAILGIWIGLRAAMLAPWWEADVASAPATRGRVAEAPARTEQAAPPSARAFVLYARSSRAHARPSPAVRRFAALVAPDEPERAQPSLWSAPVALELPGPAPRFPALRARRGDRWSGSAWLFVRGGAGAPVAPGGTLGGSQAGLRLAWRINRDPARPLALSARLYTPLGRRSGAEAGVGLDWRPLARLPVHILAERRVALGDGARSAFALTLYGGIGGRPLRGGLRLDAYAQAGAVGARSRDLFADAAARVTAPVGGLDLGAGLWGGAQPGAARLDAGPHVSLRLPGERLRLSAEWRVRIAGDAGPGTGPVLTLGSDF